MTGFGIEDAQAYLLQGGHGETFDLEFFNMFGVKSAILQGIVDAAREVFTLDKIEKYQLELLEKIDGKPKADLPFNLRVRKAQVVVYQRALTLNTTRIMQSKLKS